MMKIVTMNFINNVQFVSYAFLLYHGFSVGISDCITTKFDEINHVIKKSFIEANGNKEQLHWWTYSRN